MVIFSIDLHSVDFEIANVEADIPGSGNFPNFWIIMN